MEEIAHGMERTLSGPLSASKLEDANWCYLEIEFYLLCYSMLVFDNIAEN